jgi:hypothetical protein
MADKEASTYGEIKILSVRLQARKQFGLCSYFPYIQKFSHELPINHMKQSIPEPLADNTAL